MKIINLTQHAATPEQVAAGVIDLEGDDKSALIAAMTFDDLPDSGEISDRAEAIAEMAATHDFGEECYPDAAMIGGALWLMAPLERELIARGITPLYAFSRRESVEKTGPDGAVTKINVFRHVGFVEVL